MRLYWTMPLELKVHYKQELYTSRQEQFCGNLPAAWRHLERAHIISQAWSKQHTYAHWRMLRFGITIKSWKEVLGQLPRLLFGGIKSFIGIIPIGNTGGANVPPLRVMEIPKDLLHILEPYRYHLVR